MMRRRRRHHGQRPNENPQPTQPGQPDVPPPEVSPPVRTSTCRRPAPPPRRPEHLTMADENENQRDDPRPDIQQAVEARSDAVARGEGGKEPARQ
ncbi:hypothetical protein AB5I41_03145 [Sphingomonas sp. MMS24-JH45]